MKKYLSTSIAFILLASVTGAAYTQSPSSDANLYAKAFFESNGSPVTLNENKDTAVTLPVGLNLRALRGFNKMYKTASHAKWYILDRGQSMVHFSNDFARVIAFYDKWGQQISRIRYYNEKGLPFAVRNLVRSKYYDFSIYVVIEVTVRDKTAYFVKIEDNTCWKTIKAVDGEMEVTEEFDKT